jgi:hypothetical protein
MAKYLDGKKVIVKKTDDEKEWIIERIQDLNSVVKEVMDDLPVEMNKYFMKDYLDITMKYNCYAFDTDILMEREKPELYNMARDLAKLHDKIQSYYKTKTYRKPAKSTKPKRKITKKCKCK